ncbi:MAG: hypothetical protein ACLRMJ_01485 [Alistipes finegoldii]
MFEPMPEEAAAQVTAENSADGNRSQKMAEAKKNLLAGALWCVGGLAFSFLSYYFATAGGRYVVATGAIIWGAIQAIKGLVVILKIQHQEGRFTAFWRTAALAACSLAALLYLGQLSVRWPAAKRCRWWIPNKSTRVRRESRRRFPPDTPCSKKPCSRNGRNLRLLRFRHLQRPDRLQSGQGRGYDSGGDHVRR